MQEIFYRQFILGRKSKCGANRTDRAVRSIITIAGAFLIMILFTLTWQLFLHFHAGHFGAANIFFLTYIAEYRCDADSFKKNCKKKK
jgi:hypothetical protein